MRKVTQFKILDEFRLELTFDDGVRSTVDLLDLGGRGVFAFWMDRKAFEDIHIRSSGELAWRDRVDLCPDSLYLRATGKKPQDILPNAGGDLYQKLPGKKVLWHSLHLDALLLGKSLASSSLLRYNFGHKELYR